MAARCPRAASVVRNTWLHFDRALCYCCYTAGVCCSRLPDHKFLLWVQTHKTLDILFRYTRALQCAVADRLSGILTWHELAQENLKMRKYMSKSSLVYRPGRNIAGQFTTLYLCTRAPCEREQAARGGAKKN